MMKSTSLRSAIGAGHFARKQLFCRDPLIAWSHRRRYEIAVELVRQLRPTRLVDYGCGDGTLLAMLEDGTVAPPVAVGADIDPNQVADCRRRLSGRGALRFLPVDELRGAQYQSAFDFVLCMEVLEHVVDVVPVLDHFSDLLCREGHLVISVPVETGLPVLVKQGVRRVAGWRGLGDYPGTGGYTPAELAASIVAGPRARLQRPVHHHDDGSAFHDHKGFNWMALRETVRARFDLISVFGSPIRSLPPHFASQAWLVARKRG
jgi:SAM-dependent methyltransferase